ncbi:division/cell wall cluster transcriptional repressor MraZ [Eubacterium xylanophilum]|uniref:division/cell wall cluster transcriptional repressor MraZ n=1 Tax=Eubacterium xylanophilum TaxID=39497 RepID=UPI0031010342
MSTYQHSFDTKGRVIVPAKLRAELGDSFVVTKGVDGCLYGFPTEEWNKFLVELNQLPNNKNGRRTKRYFMAGAAECDIDKQGRVLIPNMLREFASMEKEVVFVGMMTKFEIWSKDAWERECAENGSDIDEAIEDLSELGISL